jgi:GTP cyclohydrolase IA
LHYDRQVTSKKTSARTVQPGGPAAPKASRALKAASLPASGAAKKPAPNKRLAKGNHKPLPAPASLAPSSSEAHTWQPPADVTPEQALDSLRILLRYMGDDPDREGLLETPARVLKSYREHFGGYAQDPSQYLAKTFTEVEGYDELVLVSDIEVFSHCEHHLVPFVGRAHVAYIPDGRIVGLSKLARVVDVFAKRLQVQEKLTAQISGAIRQHLEPLGVAVILQCQHFCMCYRGVRKPGSWTTTSKLHGLFLSDSAARMELLTLIGLHREIGGAGGA